MYLREVLCLSFVLACTTVCQAKPKHSSYTGYQYGPEERPVNVANMVDDVKVSQKPVIQFPSLDEMTSAEREANRKMAQKIAKIVERNLHMVADDVLQILSLVRTDVGTRKELEVGLDELKPKDNNLEDQDEKAFDDM